MPWVFEPNSDELEALNEAEQELNAFLDTQNVPDRAQRGFGTDRFAATPSAHSALEIAWADLIRNIGPRSRPDEVRVIGSIRRRNPFDDHKFTLWVRD
jgi:hypothetical protein